MNNLKTHFSFRFLHVYKLKMSYRIEQNDNDIFFILNDILLNLGGSVYGVWVLVNKLNLYNLVVVYTIGTMAGLMHWFYPKGKSLLWQQLYRF